MAAHFKWYPSSEEVIVPWNARYSYPSQANKSMKMTPRIPPKNGSDFAPGSVIRLEFPAQGYVNPMNTTLSFDVTLTAPAGATDYALRIQNNIQSLFSRVRLLYGATPIEDIINYNVIVRSLTEWTGTNQLGVSDQSSIAEGIGGYVSTPSAGGQANYRQFMLHGRANTTGATPSLNIAPNNEAKRRYQVNFALGMFTQDKLIPTKFMASQLAIEITLENVASCLYLATTKNATITTQPSYLVSNVNLIPEIMEFDSSYDQMFLKGLQDGGVPIKFSSWFDFFLLMQGILLFSMLVVLLMLIYKSKNAQEVSRLCLLFYEETQLVF